MEAKANQLTREDIVKMFPRKPEGDAVELFHSYDNIKDLQNAIEVYNNQERFVANLVMMQTILTVRNILLKNLEG